LVPPIVIYQEDGISKEGSKLVSYICPRALGALRGPKAA
jgi:hypothetical protein